MSDSLERISLLVEDVREQQAALQTRLATATSEIHQLRRRLKRAEQACQEVDELNRQLKSHAMSAEERAKRAERAARDHMARVA